MLWGILFGLFAGNLAFGKNWARVTAWATLVEVFVTLVIPGYLITLGKW